MPILILFFIFAPSNLLLIFKLSIMTYSSNIGVFDFTRPKVRLNGVVLDKYSLIQRLVDLDFKKFYYSLMYAMDTHSYRELAMLAEDYLSGDLD